MYELSRILAKIASSIVEKWAIFFALYCDILRANIVKFCSSIQLLH